MQTYHHFIFKFLKIFLLMLQRFYESVEIEIAKIQLKSQPLFIGLL